MAARRQRSQAGRWGWRWARRLALGLVLLVLASALPVLALRWVDPPTTAFMLAWRLEQGTPADYRFVPLERISPQLRIALVAAEDQQFPQHHGFDVGAIREALDERRSGGTRGASTISQQVAKNLFLWSGRSWLRKGLEAWTTLLIEALWPKRRILEVYANIAEFGPGVYGAEAAAQRFFGRSAAALDAPQAAALAVVLPAPRRWRVDAPNAGQRARQRWVLCQMQQLGGPGYLADCCADRRG